MSPQKQYLNAIRALAAYSEAEDNPLQGPAFVKLINELFAAIGDLRIEGVSRGKRQAMQQILTRFTSC
jgi:hypothetical protein